MSSDLSEASEVTVRVEIIGLIRRVLCLTAGTRIVGNCRKLFWKLEIEKCNNVNVVEMQLL